MRTKLPFVLFLQVLQGYELFSISGDCAMELDSDTDWRMLAIDAAHDFAETVRKLCDENPSKLADPLTHIMNDVMTELWDQAFSQSEIRHAFLEAIDDLDRYAAGQERRS